MIVGSIEWAHDRAVRRLAQLQPLDETPAGRALAAVLTLHDRRQIRPGRGRWACTHCESEQDPETGIGWPDPWPCPTIDAILDTLPQV